MECRIETQGDKRILRLDGRFDFNAQSVFRRATEDVTSMVEGNLLEVDLAGVPYLDSSALGMLLMLRDRARHHGLRVSLIHAQGNVRQVLDIANFGRIFEINGQRPE